jgi:negative regulator of sigma E activity
MKRNRDEKTSGRGAAFRAAPFAVLSTVSALMVTPAFGGQTPRPPTRAAREVRPGPRAAEHAAQSAAITAFLASESNATALLHHMVKANQAYSFVAREVSLNMNGEESEQWVRWAPKLGMRRESIRPAAGDVLIDNFRKSWLYSQRDHKWTEQNSLLPRPNGRIFDVLQSIKSGDLRAEWVGQDVVAGRPTDIVRVYPSMPGPAPTRRLWIDRATGIRLKTEDIGAAGRTLSTSYYLSIDLEPRLDNHDFQPPILPPGAAVVRAAAQKYRSPEEAAKAGVTVHTPDFLPPGFTLRIIEVSGNNHDRVTQRYANGITVVSLIAARSMPFGRKVLEQLGPSQSGFIAGPRGQRAYLWRDTSTSLNMAVLSNLPEDQIRRIADSVH